MILAFKPQFRDKILNGEKIHTIREDKTDRWQKNRIIQFCTGVRTKRHNQFSENVVKSVQYVSIFVKQKKIFVTNQLVLALGVIDSDVCLTPEKMNDLAVNDGFNNINEFFEFFENNYKTEVFIGKIIHWTYFKY